MPSPTARRLIPCSATAERADLLADDRRERQRSREARARSERANARRSTLQPHQHEEDRNQRTLRPARISSSRLLLTAAAEVTRSALPRASGRRRTRRRSAPARPAPPAQARQKAERERQRQQHARALRSLPARRNRRGATYRPGDERADEEAGRLDRDERNASRATASCPRVGGFDHAGDDRQDRSAPARRRSPPRRG